MPEAKHLLEFCAFINMKLVVLVGLKVVGVATHAALALSSQVVLLSHATRQLRALQGCKIAEHLCQSDTGASAGGRTAARHLPLPARRHFNAGTARCLIVGGLRACCAVSRTGRASF